MLDEIINYVQFLQNQVEVTLLLEKKKLKHSYNDLILL